MPPKISAPPTTFDLVDCVLFKNELAICTPTSESGAEPTSIHSASGTCTLPVAGGDDERDDLKTAPSGCQCPPPSSG